MRDDRHARHRRADVDRRRRPVDGHRLRDRARFERLVVDAVADLPPELMGHLASTQLLIAELPPRTDAAEDGPSLGRYVPAEPPRGHRVTDDRTTGSTTDRTTDSTSDRTGGGAGGGRLELYRRPLESHATSKRDLAELVRAVVIHELAHHLGIDDDRLGELGWG